MPEPTKESGWQILRAEADDLRRKLKNVHDGRERAIERARVAESLNTRYEKALVNLLAAARPHAKKSRPLSVTIELADDLLAEALAPDAGTETNDGNAG